MTTNTTRTEDSIDYRFIDWIEATYPSKKKFTVDARFVGKVPKGFYYFTNDNALNTSWGKNKVFIQLPLTGSKKIKAWLSKAYSEAQREGCEVWVYCPRVVTGNDWFTSFIPKAKKVIFLQGRMVMRDRTERMPHSSCFIQFDGKVLGGPIVSSASIKTIISETTLKSDEKVEYEVKRKALSEDRLHYFPNTRPVEIKVDAVQDNEERYLKLLDISGEEQE